MEKEHYRRVYRGNDCDTDNISHLLYRRNPLPKLKYIREHILKQKIIPICVASTALLLGFAQKTYARIFEPNINTYQNKTDWSLSGFWGNVKEIPKGVTETFQGFADLIQWFKDLPANMSDYTFAFTEQVYSLISSLIIKTPIWLFDNSWFENTTQTFSIISISVVTILTIIESIKKMFKNKTARISNAIDIRTVAKRWFFVAGLSSIAPILFKRAFQILNWLSQKIMSLSQGGMVSAIQHTATGFDIFVLLIFNITLLGMSVPIIIKNARRFWDILMMACCSPVIATTYIFDSHKHHFNKWWRTLKQLSLVQLVYSFFLLMIGLVIHGIPTPVDSTGQFIKLLMVVGGFSRLVNPPTFVKQQLDSGGDITDSIKRMNKQGKSFVSKIKKGCKAVRSPIKTVPMK